MPEHVEHIHLQRRAGTMLFGQRQHFVSVHDDVKADQLPSVQEICASTITVKYLRFEIQVAYSFTNGPDEFLILQNPIM